MGSAACGKPPRTGGKEEQEEGRDEWRHRQEGHRHAARGKDQNAVPVAAGEYAQRDADRGRHNQGRQAEEYGVRRPFADERGDRTAESKRLPEVEPRLRDSQSAYCSAKRPIEPQAVPFGGQDRRVGAERVVSGSEVRRARATPTRPASTSNAAKTVRRRMKRPRPLCTFSMSAGTPRAAYLRRLQRAGVATASVSALQSNCGSCGAGRALATRALTASVTLGVTK